MKNILLVAFRPRKVFESLKDSASKLWILALILLLAISLARGMASVSATKQMAKQQFKQMQAEMDKETKNVPPNAQRETQMGPSAGVLVAGNIMAVVGTAIGFFLSVGILLFVLRLLGSNSGFAGLATVMSLSMVPYVFRELIWFVYTIAMGKLPLMQGIVGVFYNNQNPFMGAPLNESPPIWITMALSRIDIFVIWSLIIMAIGLVAIAGLPRKKAVAVTAGYWIAGLLILILPMMLSMAFMSTSTVVAG